MKTVYDLHRFWTSMSAIFGFTFHIGRMTEVLTPDIYIELTGQVRPQLNRLARFPCKVIFLWEIIMKLGASFKQANQANLANMNSP